MVYTACSSRIKHPNTLSFFSPTHLFFLYKKAFAALDFLFVKPENLEIYTIPGLCWNSCHMPWIESLLNGSFIVGILVVDHLMVSELRPSTLTSGNVPNGHPSAEIIRQCHGGHEAVRFMVFFCGKNTGNSLLEDEVYSFFKMRS